MVKASQRRINFVLKRKRDGTTEIEGPLAAANDCLPLLISSEVVCLRTHFLSFFSLARPRKNFKPPPLVFTSCGVGSPHEERGLYKSYIHIQWRTCAAGESKEVPIWMWEMKTEP
jgi:hypothetical protein